MTKKSVNAEISFAECIVYIQSNPDFACSDFELGQLQEYFEEWIDTLEQVSFTDDGQEYILFYLPLAVEEKIDLLWQSSPSLACQLCALAQSICLAGATKILGKNCACFPFPRINDTLKKYMQDKGYLTRDHISFKFAVFTFYPVIETCSVCALQAGCPKLYSTNATLE